ncbi:hypothetical protein F7725_010605 [Dissostichus mawsoni]|uniref:Uncharacterized protein n=1 Tax=Dissostichus mawsoni TaxID=36200 RepID=A0A7J5XQH5_DISMA|nr:hypothetical protein F7725_010605 [Dissostichus mawsoni]
MTSELEEDKKPAPKRNLRADVLNTASVTAIKDRLTELQEESLKKDKDIESLHSNTSRGETKSSSLQMDYEAAVSAEEGSRRTGPSDSGEPTPRYENKRLQSELEATLNKQHIEEKKLQGDRGACSRLEEAIKKEEARFSRASKKIQSQEKELSEKTLALEGLQRDYEAAVSAEEGSRRTARLTQGNQHLAYEKKDCKHIEEKKLQGDRGACSRLEEAIKKEEARFSRASKKIQSQEKELSEKTLALKRA